MNWLYCFEEVCYSGLGGWVNYIAPKRIKVPSNFILNFIFKVFFDPSDFGFTDGGIGRASDLSATL